MNSDQLEPEFDALSKYIFRIFILTCNRIMGNKSLRTIKMAFVQSTNLSSHSSGFSEI